MKTEDDQTLVVRCRNGDRAAFGALVVRYQKPVYNAALRMLRDPEDARDEFEHNFQARNLEEVGRFPLTQGQRIGTEPVGWVSRMFIDETSNSLVGGLMYPGVVAHLGAVSLADGT
jgi:hypothetical protein